MARYRAVRGTFDLLPSQVTGWVQVENTARDLAHRFGFKEIRTPLFEQAELYTRGMGVMSGLIEKELWTFQDKFGQKLALRADMTAGVIRAYQENKLYDAGIPQKVFYLAPVFLLGKEGEERSRQSHQFGFEALGSDSAALDAEVIALAMAFCEAVGLEDCSVRLNSLGGDECRPQYQAKLRDYFHANVEQLCSVCKRKYKAHPDWVLSCEEEGCKQLAQVAPTIYGTLSNGAKQHFAALREYLQAMELPVELDPRVVRDSEYYNRTVFEIRCGDQSIGFGGRYDGLVEKLGGKSTPAVGFAVSLEAVMDLLGEQTEDSEASGPQVYLQAEGPESLKLLVPLLNLLRQRGVWAELDYRSSGRGGQRPPAGCSHSVFLDESNAFRGNAILKDLVNNKEEKVSVQRLRTRVLHLAGVSAENEREGQQSGRKKLRRGRRRPEDERDERAATSTTEDDSESRGGREKRSRKLRRGRGKDDSSGGDAQASQDSQESKPRREARPTRDSRPSRDARPSREAPEQKADAHDGEKTRDREDRGRSDRDRDDRDRDRDDRDKERPIREKRPRPSRSEREDHSEGDGKAIVPAFNLGGIGKKPAAPKAKPAKVEKPSAAASKPQPQPSFAGGLNWSILPGKEAESGNGKSSKSRQGGS